MNEGFREKPTKYLMDHIKDAVFDTDSSDCELHDWKFYNMTNGEEKTYYCMYKNSEMKNTKSKKRTKTRIIVLILMFIAIAAFIIVILFSKQKIATNIGLRYAIQGVDVSHYQGDIDWNVLEEQGTSFAYIKATEGSSYVDSCLDKNYQGIHNTGLDYGFYHFLSLESSPEKQFENFKAAVGEYQMVSLFEQQYGQKPVVYTTQSYYFKYFYGEKLDFPIWIRNVYFSPFQDWTIWQYTDKAIIDGYDGDEIYIDCDVIKDSEYKNIKINM